MFTRFRVAYSCGVRWHNIEKARRVLGYEPQVGVEEGIKRMISVRHSSIYKGYDRADVNPSPSGGSRRMDRKPFRLITVVSDLFSHGRGLSKVAQSRFTFCNPIS